MIILLLRIRCHRVYNFYIYVWPEFLDNSSSSSNNIQLGKIHFHIYFVRMNSNYFSIWQKIENKNNAEHDQGDGQQWPCYTLHKIGEKRKHYTNLIF